MEGVQALADQLRAAIGGRHEVLEAYLFGSRARGDASGHSDIDVAVFLAQVPDSPFGYDAELAGLLMKATGTSRVDVVLLHAAPPLLYHRVLRDGIRLFARDLTATTTREGQALSRYCDYVPQLAKVEAASRGRIRGGTFGR